MRDLDQHANAMIWGALVADAASLGFHWLYDQPRIKTLVPERPEFHPPTPSDYDDVPGYFAHGHKRAGDLSHYGEQAMVMLETLQGGQDYDSARYQETFQSYFGYGGSFHGYIDGATRDALDNMAAEKRPSGSDDLQMPALCKLPALLARHHAHPEIMNMIEDAVRVTNNSDIAVAYGQVTGQLLTRALSGTPDLAAIADQANGEVAVQLKTALALSNQTTQDATTELGLACYLKSALPSVFHNLATSSTYAEGVRKNIYAGGDSCGRAVILGAALGAIHGIGGANGIPQDWIDRLRDKERIEKLL